MTDAHEKGVESPTIKRPTRHAVIMRGVIAPFFGLLAIAAIVIGGLNATIWKPSREITSSARVSGTRYVLTDPGVLSLVDANTRLTVSSGSNKQMCVALATPKDVAGWTAGHGFVRITGLQDWSTLSTEHVSSRSTESQHHSGVAFKNSDMWQSVRCSKKLVSVSAHDSGTNRLALIDLGNDSSAANVTLHWVRRTVPDFAMPLYFVGGLCIVLCALSASVFAMSPQKRRKSKPIKTPVAQPEEVSVMDAVTGSFYGLKEALSNTSSNTAHRHGTVLQGQTSQDDSRTQMNADTRPAPSLIDPTVHNMLEGQQTEKQKNSEQPTATTLKTPDSDSGEREDSEGTAAISDDDFQAYLERLAQEESSASDDEPPSDVEQPSPAGKRSGDQQASNKPPAPAGNTVRRSKKDGKDSKEQGTKTDHADDGKRE